MLSLLCSSECICHKAPPDPTLHLATYTHTHVLARAHTNTHARKPHTCAHMHHTLHLHPTQGVCFSPDGKWVARFGYGPEVIILSAATGSVAAALSQQVRGCVWV